MLRLAWAALVIPWALASRSSSMLCCRSFELESLFDEDDMHVLGVRDMPWHVLTGKLVSLDVATETRQQITYVLEDVGLRLPRRLDQTMPMFNYVWSVMQTVAVRRAVVREKLRTVPSSDRKALLDLEAAYVNTYKTLLTSAVPRFMPERKQWIVILMREALESGQADLVSALVSFARSIRESLNLTLDSDSLYVHGLRAGHRKLLEALCQPRGALDVVSLRGSTLFRLLGETYRAMDFEEGKTNRQQVYISDDGETIAPAKAKNDVRADRETGVERPGSGRHRTLSSDTAITGLDLVSGVHTGAGKGCKHDGRRQSDAAAKYAVSDARNLDMSHGEVPLYDRNNEQMTLGERVEWAENLMHTADAAAVGKAMEIAYDFAAEAAQQNTVDPFLDVSVSVGLACLGATALARRTNTSAVLTARQVTIAAALVDRVPNCASVRTMHDILVLYVGAKVVNRLISAVESMRASQSLHGKVLAGVVERISATPRTQAVERILLQDDGRREALVGCACAHCGRNLLDARAESGSLQRNDSSWPLRTADDYLLSVTSAVKVFQKGNGIQSSSDTGDDAMRMLSLEDENVPSKELSFRTQQMNIGNVADSRNLGIEDVDEGRALSPSDYPMRTSAKLMATVDVELEALEFRRPKAVRRRSFLRLPSRPTSSHAPRPSGSRIAPIYGTASAYMRHGTCGARYHEECWAHIEASGDVTCVLCGKPAVDADGLSLPERK